MIYQRVTTSEVDLPDEHHELSFYTPPKHESNLPDSRYIWGPDFANRSHKDDTSASETEPQEAQGRDRYGLVWKRWVFEISAYALAVMALIAIVVTLKIHEGRPLLSWPFRISVNTLISIFSVILKAMMLVPVTEGESREPFLALSSLH